MELYQLSSSLTNFLSEIPAVVQVKLAFSVQICYIGLAPVGWRGRRRLAQKVGQDDFLWQSLPDTTTDGGRDRFDEHQRTAENPVTRC
jgi:hypothetical protein